MKKNIDVEAINKHGSQSLMTILILMAFVLLGGLSIYQMYEKTVEQERNIEYALDIIKNLEKFELPAVLETG